MRRISSLALFSALGVLGMPACARPHAAPIGPEPLASASASPSTSASVPPSPSELARAFLAPFAVADDAPVRRVLYTWTNSQQLEELDRDEVLLTRATSAAYGASGFDKQLASRPASDAVASLLRDEAYAQKRFAWPAPWGTVSGLAGTPYGNRLVRIVLADSAIVLRHVASTGAWDGFDMAGAPVSTATVLAHPERIACVYYVSDVVAPGRPAYREYVIVNESQVAQWSFGDAATERLLADAASAIDRLPATVHDRGTEIDDWVGALPVAWHAGAADDAASAWASTLAFATREHAPERGRLDRIAQMLRGAPHVSTAKTHAPTAKFALTGRKTATPSRASKWAV